MSDTYTPFFTMTEEITNLVIEIGEQVTDVINGKTVLGPPQDIREVKNAYETYDRISAFDPYSVKICYWIIKS